MQISAITIYKTDPDLRFLLNYTVEMLPPTELLSRFPFTSELKKKTLNKCTDVSLPCITSLLLRFSKTRILVLEW